MEKRCKSCEGSKCWVRRLPRSSKQIPKKATTNKLPSPNQPHKALLGFERFHLCSVVELALRQGRGSHWNSVWQLLLACPKTSDCVARFMKHASTGTKQAVLYQTLAPRTSKVDGWPKLKAPFRQAVTSQNRTPLVPMLWMSGLDSRAMHSGPGSGTFARCSDLAKIPE